jgi:hypothetical protein
MAGVQDSGTDPELPVEVDDWDSAFDAAVQTVFQHGELLNVGAATAATVKSIITNVNDIVYLTQHILKQAEAHQKDPKAVNWVFETTYSNTPRSSTLSSKPRYIWSNITQQWMLAPMKESLLQAKNDPTLQSTRTVAGCYTVQDGITGVGAQRLGVAPAPLRGTSLAAPARSPGDSGGDWTVNNYTSQHGFTYNNDISLSSDRILTASFTNSWVRWLSGYVEFLGPDGKTVVKPDNWTSQVPGGLAGTYDSDTKKYVALFSSANTMIGYPLAASPTTISFRMPSNASGVRFLAGGIGRSGGIEGQDGTYYGGWDQLVCAPGAMMTGIFCLGLPTLCLAMGAIIPQVELEKLTAASIGVALDSGAAIVNGALGGADITSIMETFADVIPHLLLDSPDFLAAITAAVGEEVVEESTPIFGWIALGYSILTTVTNLIETIAEICLSPAVFTLEATVAIDAQWTLLPDPEDKQWPEEATHYVVTATFSDSDHPAGSMISGLATTRIAKGKVGPSPQTAPITVLFNEAGGNQLPGGGTVTFAAAFYSDSDWLCGGATREPQSASAPSGMLVVPTQAIKEVLIPLQASTRYLYGRSLAFDSKGRHVWADARPQATVSSLNPSNIGNNIGELGQITANQPQHQLGYSWQASGQDIPFNSAGSPSNNQMYVFQTVSTLGDPENGLRFVPSGFAANAPIAYDLRGEPHGDHFYIDSGNSLFHLGKIALDGSSGKFTLSVGVSWGRFNQPIDACIIHPSGVAVGLNTTNAKLEVLSLSAGVADKDAPLAEIYAGYGSRPGLLHRPVGLAPAVGSGVIVLQNADDDLNVPARLQAFDLKGNPAPIFAGSLAVAPLRAEDTTVTCLAIATESKGFTMCSNT